MTVREYNLQLLKCVWSCFLCLTKIILSLIIIHKSIWSKVLWWLIGHVWIKGNLIPTAHLSKPLKHPSWNCCRLPDNIDQSQITPAYCKLAWDLRSLVERRKEIYNGAAEKKEREIAAVSSKCCDSIYYYLTGDNEQCGNEKWNESTFHRAQKTCLIECLCKKKKSFDFTCRVSCK